MKCVLGGFLNRRTTAAALGSSPATWRHSVNIGDAVIVKHGRYRFGVSRPNDGKMPWVWVEHLGIITDNRGKIDGTAEYRVYTVDGKHSWCHGDDLRIAR